MMTANIRNHSGFTLVELLVALFLAGAVTAAALRFYVSEHNNLIAQHNISDMQQNLRVSSNTIANALRNAGASLPDGIAAIQSTNTDPDSLITRRTAFGGSLAIRDHTEKKTTEPIIVELSSDVSAFPVGERAYIWHSIAKQGEWFTVTSIVDNGATGWKEVYHQSDALLYDPRPGDVILALSESKFYIDNSDTTRPLLMYEHNSGGAQVFAEYINDFDLKFVLSTSDTVDSPGINDTVMVAQINIAAHTAEVDMNSEDFGQDGRRRRSLSTEVLIRNNRF